MKKLITIICIIFVLASLSLGFAVVHADEPVEETEIVEVAETVEETEAEKKIDALIGKANAILNKATDKWETVWKPVIIACGSLGSIFITIFITVKKVKKWKEAYNFVAKEYNALEKNADGLKSQAETKGELAKANAEITNLKEQLSGLKTEISGLKKVNDTADKTLLFVKKLYDGANYAWAKSSEAKEMLYIPTEEQENE